LLGLPQPVTSIDQAIMVLGREQLYRWLSIGVFRAGAGSPRDEVLLELALSRGRFLELIGRGRHGKAECDELFLVGLLSLLDSLLGVPMARVVERMHLSAAMRDVLLQSEGPLGRYLMLAIAVEKGRVEAVDRLATQLSIPLAEIETASAEALTWAEEALRLGA
jgi:EAL and modified HD-GYP domain-containing signal transduction protein